MLLFLISFLVLADFRAGLLGAFLLGLGQDLWLANVLGVSSLKFLILGLVINLYKQKVRAGSFRYLLPFSFLTFGISRVLEGLEWKEAVGEGFWGSLLMIPTFFVFSRMWYKIFGKRDKIEV